MRCTEETNALGQMCFLEVYLAGLPYPASCVLLLGLVALYFVCFSLAQGSSFSGEVGVGSGRTHFLVDRDVGIGYDTPFEHSRYQAGLPWGVRDTYGDPAKCCFFVESCRSASDIASL